MPRPSPPTIKFYFDDKEVVAYKGDTIASALLRAGIYTISRSLKFHRRRGVRCFRGYCRSCLVEVNGVPNVPACLTLVEDNMVVKSQNAYPNASYDVLSILDKLPHLTSYNTIYEGAFKNPLLWSLASKVIEKITGLGRFPQTNVKYEYSSEGVIETDVAIIGGGLSGLAAANMISQYNVKTVIVESLELLGGRARLDPIEDANLKRLNVESPKQLAEKLIESISKNEHIVVINNSDAYGLYPEERKLGVYIRRSYNKGSHVLIRAKVYIVASGAYEIPGNFRNNDVPGIIYDYGFRRLILDYNVKPKGKVLIVGNGGYGERLKRLLESLNVSFEGPVLDTDTNIKPRLVEVRYKEKIRCALLEFENGIRKVDAEYVVISKGYTPALEIAGHAGVPIVYDEKLGQYVPSHNMYMETPIDNVLVTGDTAGCEGYYKAYVKGEIAGLTALVKILGERKDVLSLREEKVKSLGGG